MAIRYRRAPSALSFDPDRAGQNLPIRDLWIEALPWDPETLSHHPVFRAAELNPEFRQHIRTKPRAVLKGIRHTPDGPPKALLWRAIGYRFEPSDRFNPVDVPTAAYGRHGPVYRRGRDWIGLSERYVWTAAGGRSDHLAIGLYVQILAGLSEDGASIPRTRQGPIPEDDEDALAALAPSTDPGRRDRFPGD